MQSLPSRERGLKSNFMFDGNMELAVAPLAGAWIEIFPTVRSPSTAPVAPLAGAWIEINL